jgi:hypothetical protein
MFEKRALKRILGLSNEEVSSERGNLHNDFHDLYSLHDVQRRIEWARHV